MYNKSKIMKDAWELFKKSGWKFSVCLSTSWRWAKKESEKNAPVKANAFVNGMTLEVSGYEFTLNRWKKNGIDRVYLNGSRSDGYGYIDLVKGEYHPKTNFDPAKNAAKIVANMTF